MFTRSSGLARVLMHAQRLGMMILLGQHGQRQDYQLGLEYIRMAAESCDENAPQGAYVSDDE